MLQQSADICLTGSGQRFYGFSVLYVVYSGGHDQFSGFQFIGCDDAASVTHQAHYGYFAAAHLIVGRGVYKYTGLAVFLQNGIAGYGHTVGIVIIATDGNHCIHAGRRNGLFVRNQLQAHGVQLVCIGFGSDADKLQRVTPVRINVECAVILVELLTPDIFGCRQIYLYFRCTATNHGQDRHAGAYCLVRFEQTFCI